MEKRKLHFFKIMMPGFQHKLNLPESFCNNLKLKAKKIVPKEAVVKSRLGTWRMTVICKNIGRGLNPIISFTNGWPDFVVRHGLTLWDLVVFQHTPSVDDLQFTVVFVFDATASQKDPSIVLPKSSLNLSSPNSKKTLTKKNQQQEKKRGSADAGKNNVFFTATVKRWPVAKRMWIPVEFLRAAKMEKTTSVVLRNGDGREWGVVVTMSRERGGKGVRGRMGAGWGQFYDENNLKAGDVCTFHLVSNKRLRSPNHHLIVIDVQIRHCRRRRRRRR
ncbi:B3 domain-containing protein REM8-like [Andrographis paniculata]|uniref:B3 domain-containing protein REM8-like n=1 Tax=Andrographis paniculata TaxID=175694 RepID=UPI0021E6F713|nr:B3 domain-containing protein REM8-like [Andrographis paniculata]